MIRISIVVGTLIICQAASADLQLKVKDFSSRVSTISSNGAITRIETDKLPGYALVNFTSGKILMVDPQRRQAVSTQLDSNQPENAGGAIDIRFKDKGGGRKISGYLTKKFEFSADGERCGTVYTSKKLLKDPKIAKIFTRMHQLTRLTRSLAGEISESLSLCQRALLQLSDAIADVGAPLKILDAGGSLHSEVLAVDTDHNINSSFYQLPGGIAVVKFDATQMRAPPSVQQSPSELGQMMEQLRSGDGDPVGGDSQQLQQLKQMLEKLQQQ